MTRLVPMWPRPRGRDRRLVFTVDRPRRIDRVIDYFGEPLARVMISGERETTPFMRRPSIIETTRPHHG